MWLAVALCGPVLWAASTHIDKFLVDKYSARYNVVVLLVLTALISLAMLPFIAVAQPASFDLAPRAILILTVSGAASMIAMYAYLVALTKNEASVVAPLFGASVVFAFALGYIFLHERPTSQQLWASTLILLGTGFVSIDPTAGRRPLNARLVVLMFACAFVLAAGTIVFKAFAVTEAFWPATFWTYLGQAVFGFAVLLVPSYRHQFENLIRRSAVPLLTINGLNEALTLAGSLTARYALLLAPVGLVQAVTSTTTVFVFLIGAGLAAFFPSQAGQRPNSDDLLRKGVATLAVTLGVAFAAA